MNLGELECEIKPTTTGGSVYAPCTTGDDRPWVKIENKNLTIKATTKFVVIANNVPNPGATGATANFHVSVVDGTSIVD
jgi:hypothetical protein